MEETTPNLLFRELMLWDNYLLIDLVTPITLMPLIVKNHLPRHWLKYNHFCNRYRNFNFMVTCLIARDIVLHFVLKHFDHVGCLHT